MKTAASLCILATAVLSGAFIPPSEPFIPLYPASILGLLALARSLFVVDNKEKSAILFLLCVAGALLFIANGFWKLDMGFLDIVAIVLGAGAPISLVFLFAQRKPNNQDKQDCD